MQQAKKGSYFEVASDVWSLTDILVNVFIVRNSQTNQWVLIDAGLKTTGKRVKKMADDLFGPNSRPQAILLTHGHFDHVGSLRELTDDWNVDAYAHNMEMPYLTGKSAYPPPDPTVDGGLMAKTSWLLPKGPYHFENRLKKLPEKGNVPFLPDWKYIYTPGHAPGHVSFFREKDGVLIAGDAIVTTKQESLLSIMTQKEILSGPPKYFTYDWEASADSFRRLADLKPKILATGHGKPLKGERMEKDLAHLAAHFEDLAVPKKGRYVGNPAIVDEKGVKYLPPKQTNHVLMVIALVTLAAILALILFLREG